MRYLWFSLLLAFTLNAQQAPQRECYNSDEETINSLLDGDIVGLQMQLYALSQFQPKTPADVVNLQKVTREAVFSLANEFAVYSERFQKCAISDDEYYSKTSEANTMVLNILEVVGVEIYWQSILPDKWPLKDIEPLVGHLAENPAIRGRKLPVHPVMEDILQAYARTWNGQSDITDPVQTASLALLGKKEVWDIKKFRLIKLAEINRDNLLGTPHFFFSGKVEEFNAKPISEKLAILADYYLPE